MDKDTFNQLVANVSLGKHLPEAIYLHRDAFSVMPAELAAFIHAVANVLKVPDDDWQLVKLSKKNFRLSLLNYPDFYSNSYPALKKSITIDLTKLSHRITEYKETDNPPILHRKELMVLPDSSYFKQFKQLTEEGANAGLYENPRVIGFKQSWENLIRQKGYELVDGRLFRLAMITATNDHTIDRHKTAIVRHALSAPMKALAKQGYLDGDYSLFDYGCGRQDDMRELLAHGVDVMGWDPNFYPDGEKTAADIVNLGFVLNVIEDKHERLEALIGAWELTNQFLVVSVMLATDEFINQFKPYKDGVITSRNTFQKYYLQSEIKGYIERSLDEIPIAVSPGIFFIFKDKLAEQAFLQNRYRRNHKWQQVTSPSPNTGKDKAKLLITQHQAVFDAFWLQSLELGRVPANDEFSDSTKIRQLVGSHLKVHQLMCDIYGQELFEQARQQKQEDLLLYFAMGSFEKRKPYTKQPESLKRDIKAFFGDYKTALTLAQDALYQIADTNLIEQACNQAQESLPASLLNSGHSLIFHKQFINELPQILRIYVSAALQMYGELNEIDLIKIHITSGKLTLTGYDNFDNQAVPSLKERVKIKMAQQDIDFFDYINTERRPPLLNKSLYLSSHHEHFNKQRSFDKRLAKLLGISHQQEVMLSREVFERGLKEERVYIKGYRLLTIKTK